MGLFLLLLLFGTPGVNERRPVPVTACEIIANADRLDGKLVTLYEHIVRGPHDEYLIAEHCSDPELAHPYIYFSYDPHVPTLRKFHKLFTARATVKNCNDCFKYDITGDLIGYIRKVPPGGFGAISAKVGIELVNIKNIRKRRIEIDHAETDPPLPHHD